MLPPAQGLTRATAVAAVLLVSLAGCSNDDPATSSHRSASPSERAASSASDPSASASSQSTSQARRSGGPLLTAKELPRLGSSRWARSATTMGPHAFNPCQRFGLLAIGAEHVVARHFGPAAASSDLEFADEAVATFPDAMTARRAYSVLESWRTQCGNLRRRYPPELGDLLPVTVPDGQAAWYLLTYPPHKSAHRVLLFAQGMAQVGPRIAMVRMARSGESTGDLRPPIEDAVAAAAGRLRQS